MPSRETETRSRGRLALDRDGASREGGGVQPSSEAESRSRAVRPSSETDPHSRVRSTHERGGFVPRRCRTPRAERSPARGWLGRLIDVPWARGFILRVCLGLFAFVFYEFKRVSPCCSGDPYGSPRQCYIVQIMG
jgi:hypothetical protein